MHNIAYLKNDIMLHHLVALADAFICNDLQQRKRMVQVTDSKDLCTALQQCLCGKHQISSQASGFSFMNSRGKRVEQ